MKGKEVLKTRANSEWGVGGFEKSECFSVKECQR